MIQNIKVSCLINRYWTSSTMDWDGDLVNRSWTPSVEDWDGDLVSGTLIDISTQSAEDGSGNIIPVGVVLLEDGTFQCVPLEFIQEIQA